MKALELAATMEYSLGYQQENGRRVMELERAVPLAAAELRRLAEVNAELLEALEKCVAVWNKGGQEWQTAFASAKTAIKRAKDEN